MLTITDLNVYYGVIHALKGVSLQVAENEIVALIGANGAGKTTLLRTVTGLITPRSGGIEFRGGSLLRLKAHERVAAGIAMVPEGRGIFPNLTVRENLLVGAFVYRNDKARVQEDLDKVLGQFPILMERQHQAGGTLSGGEQQMLAIGRALMSRPRLILLDEPSMGLAPFLIPTIFKMIKEIRASGATVLLVEQNANAALRVADRAYVLETGSIVHSGSAASIMGNPEVRAAYLG